MESYVITNGTHKPSNPSNGLFRWSDRGIYWEKMNEGDSFLVNSMSEAMSVSTCFRTFQKIHPSMSKNLRVVRRKEQGTDFYRMFFVSDDGSTKNRGSRKKKLSPEHREKIRAAHRARWQQD